ncbi:MAG: hypothetical protein RSB22_07745 [Acinetobacter sp.]
MTEKLTDSASFRVAHDELVIIDALAAKDGVCRGEWIRNAVMSKISEARKQHDYLARVFCGAKDTVNTSYSDIKKPDVQDQA